MRNLKRALSLALASVMLLGMMVVGTSASYADVTSKQNQEAIEVHTIIPRTEAIETHTERINEIKNPEDESPFR